MKKSNKKTSKSQKEMIKTCKPSELLATVKKASECKDRKELQSNINKVEGMIDTLTEKFGDASKLPPSLQRRLDSLETALAKELSTTYSGGEPEKKDEDKPQPKAEASKTENNDPIQDKFHTITGENDFVSVVNAAKKEGYKLVSVTDNSEVVGFEIGEKKGRKFVTLETEKGKHGGYYFDSKTHPIRRYAQLVK